MNLTTDRLRLHESVAEDWRAIRADQSDPRCYAILVGE